MQFIHIQLKLLADMHDFSHLHNFSSAFEKENGFATDTAQPALSSEEERGGGGGGDILLTSCAPIQLELQLARIISSKCDSHSDSGNPKMIFPFSALFSLAPSTFNTVRTTCSHIPNMLPFPIFSPLPLAGSSSSVQVAK